MSLTITARFVLGTYQGRSPGGTPEPFPETDRLFAAFVAAAGAGPHAEAGPDGLQIPVRHRAALAWLESTPPDCVALPDYRFNTPSVTAYRVSGLRNKGSYASPASRDAVSRSSLAGPISWSWDDQPDPHVVAALAELAPEVAYLGEANSPVRVEVDDRTPSEPDALRRVPDNELFPAAAVPISTPLPGRLSALEASHVQRAPSGAVTDGVPAKNEAEVQHRRPDAGLTVIWYRHPERERPRTYLPWENAIALEVAPQGSVSWPPAATDRVAWALALHRALAKVLSPAAPPLVTGHYPEGARVPANRLAIQIVNSTDPVGWVPTRGVRASFVLLVPRGATPAEQDAIVRAVQLVAERRVYVGGLGAVKITRARFVDGAEFWREPPLDLQRWWVPHPVAVAETRAQGGAGQWGLEEAALLALGMVWRDELQLGGRGTEFYRRLVAAARPHVAIRSPRQVVGQDVTRFVHRVSASNVVTAYSALFRFDGTVNARAPLAIGQSRHLGTGLLVPVDLPASLMEDGGIAPWA